MKFLLASDSPTSPTGFAGQMRFVAKHLIKTGNEVDYLGWQHMMNQEFVDGDVKFNVHPALSQGDQGNQEALFGRKVYPFYYQTLQPDVVLTLGDAWMVNQIPQYEQNPLWVMYFPVDGHPLNKDIEQTVAQAHIPVAMSKYGQAVCKDHGLQVEYIPHQIDWKRLAQYNKKKVKKANRKKYFPDLKADTVLFGSIARLNPRKHHMRLLRAFEKFVRVNKLTPDDVRLYLHLDPLDVMYHTRLNAHDYFFSEFLDTLDLQEYILFPPSDYSFAQGVSEEELLERMSCLDVHVNSTGGEGFGVPTLEVMAMGIPNIITNYTTSEELIIHKSVYSNDKEEDYDLHRGILVPYRKLHMENSGVYKAWVDTDDFAEAMELYYEDRELRKLHGRNAFKFSKQYDTKNVNAMWTALFERIPTIEVMSK